MLLDDNGTIAWTAYQPPMEDPYLYVMLSLFYEKSIKLHIFMQGNCIM